MQCRLIIFDDLSEDLFERLLYINGLVQDCSISIANTGDTAVLLWTINMTFLGQTHQPSVLASMLQHSESVPGWVQDCNISIANALEILQSYSEPSIWPFWVKHISHQCWLPCCSILKVCLAECKTAISPLLMHWRYCSLTLNHQYDLSGSNTSAISAGFHAAAFWKCAWLSARLQYLHC